MIGKEYLKKHDGKFSGLFFRKTGSEIIEQTNKELSKLETTIGFIGNKGTELCEKYKLKWSDVVAEERQRLREEHLSYGGRLGDAQESLESGPSTRYATSVMESMELESNRVPFKDRQQELRKVQRDLQSVQAYVTLLFKTEDRSKEFYRVTNNINPVDVFEFDYDELKDLGFE